jgi:hypothetical protein
MSQPVVVVKLRALLDPNTGAAIQKNPRCVAPSGIALVVLQVCARARSFLVALRSSLKVASPFFPAAAARVLHDRLRRLSG